VIERASESFLHGERSVVSPAAGNSVQHLPWHYRSVAEWWPELDVGAAAARSLVDFVRAYAGPALEVGSGAGQRLFACQRAGLVVDGCDPRARLIRICRDQSTAPDTPAVFAYCQALHELALPRQYRSIHLSILGADMSAEHDREGLRRIHRLLEPGGTLRIEHPAASHDRAGSAFWRWARLDRSQPPELPPAELSLAGGTGVLCLSSRLCDYRPAERAILYTVRAKHRVGGYVRAQRSFAVRQRLYTPNQLGDLLQQAGFDRLRIRQEKPAAQPGTLVWLVEKAPSRVSTYLMGPLGPVGQAAALTFRS
jgi:SAM-dependent methyltransferase